MKIVLRYGPEAGREFTIPDGAVSWLIPIKKEISLASYSPDIPISYMDSVAYSYRKTHDVRLDKDQTWHWVFDYDGER